MSPKSEQATHESSKQAMLSVKNLGGIDSSSIEFTPGVTLLTGRNATNRTSLLRALNGALGGTEATLKSDADEGKATLTLGDDEFTRTYTRTSSGVTPEGTPYTDAEILVDYFSTLLENNPARRAVERGDDLHDVIMRPVDTEEIEQRIRKLQREKEDLEAEYDRVQERRDTLPQLKERRRTLQDEIATIDEEIASLRDDLADVDADPEAAEDADALVDELDARRQELRDTEDDIELIESELDALRDELGSAQADREEVPEHSEDPAAINSELESLREQKRQYDNTISTFRTIVEFNEELLNEDGHDLPGIDSDNESVTSALAPEASRNVVCWTCGSQVEHGEIQDRLDDLRTMIEEKQTECTEITERIDELEASLESINQQQTRREELDRTIEETQRKLDRRENRREELQQSAADLREQIQELESKVAETQELRESDLLETYERVSDLEYERGQLKQELDEVEEEIANIDALPTPGELETQLDELSTEIERERTRIADLESEAVEQFNTHMNDILQILEYENIARVWIEQKTNQRTRGRPAETVFDLHVVRETDDGAVYEDVVTHLSESEREVIGLVVALAGHLAHEAYEVVPFMLLDSLEAIDADRIAALVEYFSDYAPHLTVALLPEDADSLPEGYERISAESFDSS